MAGKVRHLLNRSGRYFARLVVPADLRRFIGKTELRAALGKQAGEELPADLTKAEASEHIDRLQKQTGRPPAGN